MPNPETPQPAEKLDLPEGVPALRSFYLYLTNGCNLCCRHCWIAPTFVNGIPTPGEYIDFEKLKDAVEAAKPLGLSNAKLTGGEPVLHPQFVDIVDFFTEQKIPLTMETNGTLINKDLAVHLKENTSLWHISVSLDSPRPSYHDWFRGVEGAFDKTVQGIKHLVTAGYRPQIIMCPHRGNLHEIDELVKLAVDIGAGSVKFNPVNGVGRGKSLHEKGDALGFDETLSLVHDINNYFQQKSPIPLSVMLPPALLSIRELLRPGGFCGTCQVYSVLGILGSGEMALCGIGRTVPELCFGRLGVDNLKEVWINHPVLNNLRKGLAGEYPGICGDCIHSSRCLMYCIAQNYANNGKLLSPDAMCMQAEKKDVFPDSRRRSFIDSN
jgi:SynChlorMet cassette radical SAM/SPASM protein ScmF